MDNKTDDSELFGKLKYHAMHAHFNALELKCSIK